MLAETAERVVAQKAVHQPAAAWLVVQRVLVQEAWRKVPMKMLVHLVVADLAIHIVNMHSATSASPVRNRSVIVKQESVKRAGSPILSYEKFGLKPRKRAYTKVSQITCKFNLSVLLRRKGLKKQASHSEAPDEGLTFTLLPRIASNH